MSFWSNPINTLLGQQQSQPTTQIQGLSDAEYQYYQQNVQPVQQQLLNNSLNPNTLNQNVSNAQTAVNQQFSNLPGAFQRQMAGSGVVATAAQKAAFAKQSALSQGIATAAASNQAVQQTGIQQRGALGV